MSCDLQSLPKHVAFIMDGNGRWAKARGKNRSFGHRAGVESLRNIIQYCGDLGIDYVTVYAFSTENFKRSNEEVSTLMSLLSEFLKKDIEQKFQISEETFAGASEESREFLKTFAFICMLSYDVFMKKLIIEKLVDECCKTKENQEPK